MSLIHYVVMQTRRHIMHSCTSVCVENSDECKEGWRTEECDIQSFLWGWRTAPNMLLLNFALWWSPPPRKHGAFFSIMFSSGKLRLALGIVVRQRKSAQSEKGILMKLVTKESDSREGGGHQRDFLGLGLSGEFCFTRNGYFLEDNI